MSEAVAAPARRRTGRARSMTRAQVVDAALEVMSNQGLNAVSFRTVAMRLGVDPKALYTYVEDKNDLLAAMFDTVMAKLDLPDQDDPRSPVDRIVGLLISLRRALVGNADLYRLARPLDVPGFNADALDRMAQALYELDADKSVALRVFQRLLQYTLGSAMYGAHRDSREHRRPIGETTSFDEGRHPFVLALSKEAPFAEDEAGFEVTIRLMLEQRIGERE